MTTPGMQPGYPVVLRLAIRAREGAREALLEFLREATPFYEAPGGIRMRLLQRVDDPDSFIEEVEYRGAAEFDADNLRVESDEEMKRYLDRWRSLLEGKAEVTVYQDVTTKIRGGRGHGA